MEWKDLLQDLIQLVETAAPHLWQIAIKQIYVQAIGYFFVFLISLGLAITLFIMGKKLKDGSESKYTDKHLDDCYQGYMTFTCVSVFVFCASLIPLHSVIGRLVNPEYYAIELLINYVK